MNVKNLKKGFTLTELIIVIVIVGILAGVLIPTFINVVNKANRASDLSLVRNLNEALTLDSVENGKHETMYDALQAAQASGFDVAKISKKAKSNEILWDSKNDVFCYLDNGEIAYYPNSVKDDQQVQASEYYKLWKIDNNVPTNKQDQIYSIYLYGLENNLITSDITLHGIGLDVGENKVATDDTTTKITYLDDYSNDNSRHRDVVIRTDWGNLVIDAEHDSVYHYNEVNQLTVTAIKSASFHAYGFIAKIVSFVVGRFVAESTATFGQSSTDIAAALSGVVSDFSSIADLEAVCNQDAWDEFGVSKNHEGRVNQNHVHQMTAHSAVAVTCTTNGNSAYWQCNTCNKYFSDENGENEIIEGSWIINTSGHDWSAWEVTTAATCISKGEETRTCNNCPESEHRDIAIDPNAHNWEFVNFTYSDFTAINGNQDAPTALAHYHCSLCTSNATAAADVLLIDTTLANCTNDGEKVYYASIAYTDSLDHLSHNNSDNNGGVGEFTIYALGHDLQNHAAQAATCTAVGWEAYDTCSRCDYSTYQEIPASHTEVVDAAVAPSCTQTGLTEGKHCSVCNAVIVAQQVVSALGHSLEPHEANDPTTEAEGNTAYYSCSRCGKFFSDAQCTEEIEEDSWVIEKLIARTRLDIDYNITLSENILDNIIGAISNSFDGNETEKFINIVFDYSDKAIYNNYFEDGDEITPANYYNGLIKVYYKVSSNDLYTLYFLSERDLYLSETDPEWSFIFGDINWCLREYYNKTLKFNSFDFTNFHIDSSSNLHNLFAGCSLFNIDFSKLFENIELPNNKIDKIKFFYNMLYNAFLDDSCTLPNGITVDEINEMPYYIDEFHKEFNRNHFIEEDGSDKNFIPLLDFRYENSAFKSKLINFIQGDNNNSLSSAQKTILVFEADNTSTDPLNDDSFGGYFAKITFTAYDTKQFGAHGYFVVNDAEFITGDYTGKTSEYIAYNNGCDFIYNIGGNKEIYYVESASVKTRIYTTNNYSGNEHGDVFIIPDGSALFQKIADLREFLDCNINTSDSGWSSSTHEGKFNTKYKEYTTSKGTYKVICATKSSSNGERSDYFLIEPVS